MYSSASGCDLREVVTSGFACRRAVSTVLSGSPDYESGALLRCRSHSDAAWRYDRDRAVFVRLTLPSDKLEFQPTSNTEDVYESGKKWND